MKDEKLVTTKEAAEMVGVKVPTILKYVRDGKLSPYKEDPFQIDSTKLFKETDVLKLQQENKKPGMTTGEVAKRLGISPQTVINYIHSGDLCAEKHFYKGRELFFISEESLISFKSTYIETKRRGFKDFYVREDGQTIALFQLLKNPHTYEYGRIMELHISNKGKKGYIHTNEGRIIDLNDKESAEFLPINIIGDIPSSLKKGEAVFEFSMSEDIMSPVYKIIELFYRYVGLKNLNLVIEEDKIHVAVKPTTIQLDTEFFQEEIKLLTKSIKEGSVKRGVHVLVLKSAVAPINVTIPLALKERIQEDAKNTGMTMEEFVLSVISEHYSNVE